jgi:hypothetical protein
MHNADSEVRNTVVTGAAGWPVVGAAVGVGLSVGLASAVVGAGAGAAGGAVVNGASVLGAALGFASLDSPCRKNAPPTSTASPRKPSAPTISQSRLWDAGRACRRGVGMRLVE